SAGISHTFLKDDKNPALIGFLESTVYEKSRNKASSGKSWLIGATTYKAIDPVVLSLTAAYRINGSKTLSSNTKYKAGNYWMLNPNISFAANDRI
ncbi:meta-pathway of phenol degradation family protein, partial [Neisseria meningitidis]|nr:meta-pathway of phenol degradation family protein [Neisseria meningitidis]